MFVMFVAFEMALNTKTIKNEQEDNGLQATYLTFPKHNKETFFFDIPLMHKDDMKLGYAPFQNIC